MTTSSLPADARLDALHERVSLGLWAALVGVLPWLWRPGLVAPDTKLDLLTDPWGYLGRALVAWDERAGFGQLQNQAHGYLFPMGPFFGLGDSLGMPEWAVQRAWWSLVIVVAFLGAERALRSLGLGAGVFTLVPALAYALSPRVLTVLSDISVEVWPAAICPWLVVVLAPALRPEADGRARARMAVGTGLLVTATGGVNAAASLLVLLVPAVLLVTAPSGVARTRAAAWWLVGVLLGATWWLAPLVVLGFYAFPFLEFIETASVTTSVTSLPQVLRGTSHWLAYLVGPDGQATWQSGWTLAQHPVAVVATSLLAALGLAGLLRGPRQDATREQGALLDLRHVHLFAVLTLLLGVLLMSAGYAGRYGGGAATTVQQLLDGPLAAFRNVHKADPLVRFPLAVGLGWVLRAAPGRIAGWTWPALAAGRRAQAWRAWVIGVVVTTLAATLLPVWLGRVVAIGSFDRIPRYWSAAATLIDEAAERRGGSTLLLPASRSGAYVWGRTDDEPLAALASSPVVVRDAVMLGAPEASRILDVVDLLTSSGARQDGLAAVLARMGVARIVVRHDLAWEILAEDPALVEKTLERSPGFELVERLGPRSGGLTVWDVEDPRGPVDAYPADEIVRVAGGPEALVSLAGLDGERDDRAFIIGDDAVPGDGPAAGAHISTDTLRVRRLNTGRVIRDAYSQTLDARAAANDRGRDLPPAGQGDPETVRVWEGVLSVRASDEASDPFALGYRGPQHGGFAAVDGDPATAWLTSSGVDSAHLELDFADAVPAGPLRINVASGANIAEVERVRVRAGELDVERQVSSDRLVLSLDGASGASLKVTVHRRSGTRAGYPIGLAEVSVGDAGIRTFVRAAHSRSTGPTNYVLVRDPRHRMEPLRLGEDGSALEREVTAAEPQAVRAEVRVTARGGEALERVLDEPWTITGSSRVAPGPSGRPGAALDGRRDTRWRADVADLAPRLTLEAETPRTISSLRLSGGDRKRIGSVELQTPDGVVQLGNRGGEFDPLRTRELTIVFRLRDSTGEFVSPEITLDTAPRPTRVRLRCGEAGSLEVGGQAVALNVSTSRAALLEGRPVEAALCDRSRLVLPGGTSVVRVIPGDLVQGHEIVLTPETAQASDVPSLPEPAVRAWEGNRRSFDVEPSADGQVVAFSEGFNEGWRAEVGGRPLEPVRVDGWRQGFLVPAGVAGRVDAEFRPGLWYSAGLLGGGFLVVLLLVVWWGMLRHRGGREEQIAPAAATPLNRPAWSRWAGAGAVTGLLFALGSWVGLLVAVAAGLMLLLRERSAVLGPILLGAGGLVVVVSRWADRASIGADIAQLLTLGAVAVLGWRLVLPHRGDDPLLDGEPGERGDDDATERRGHQGRPETS